MEKNKQACCLGLALQSKKQNLPHRKSAVFMFSQNVVPYPLVKRHPTPSVNWNVQQTSPFSQCKGHVTPISPGKHCVSLGVREVTSWKAPPHTHNSLHTGGGGGVCNDNDKQPRDSIRAPRLSVQWGWRFKSACFCQLPSIFLSCPGGTSSCTDLPRRRW